MFASLFCVSALMLGFDVGWQPLPTGGGEYLIQFGPEDIESMRAGQVKHSDVPPEAGEIRGFAVSVGTKPLPRIGSPHLTPHPIPTEPPSRPLQADSAAYFPDESPGKSVGKAEGKPKGKADGAGPVTKSAAMNEDSAKPWMPFIFVSLALFASLGGNVYLAWLFADLFRRYRAITALKETPAVSV